MLATPGVGGTESAGLEAPGADWPGHSLNLPSLQNPSGHSFLTKEELLQKCAQEAPGVSPEVGKDGAERLWV